MCYPLKCPFVIDASVLPLLAPTLSPGDHCSGLCYYKLVCISWNLRQMESYSSFSFCLGSNTQYDDVEKRPCGGGGEGLTVFLLLLRFFSVHLLIDI